MEKTEEDQRHSVKLKMAIIGCGAVVERFHLPALLPSNVAEVSVLVDKSEGYVQKLAETFGVRSAIGDYRELPDDIDCALIALPNVLHTPVAVELLERGIHVLVEKPLAIYPAECDQMMQAAQASGANLGVAMVLRFTPQARLIKQVLATELLGAVQSVEFEQGGPFGWPARSDYMLRKDAAGGGVLMDIGVHVLDQLQWWLGDLRLLEYRDDARGGVEADCELSFGFGNGGVGSVTLSRVRNLKNSCVIKGERGTLEVGVGFDPGISLTVAGSAIRLGGKAMQGRKAEGNMGSEVSETFGCMLEDFFKSIKEGHRPAVSAAEGRYVLGLIQDCYRIRQAEQFPWEESAAPPVEKEVSAV